MKLKQSVFKNTGRFFQEPTELRKADVDGYLRLGKTLERQGRKKEALRCYESLAQIAPDHAVAHFKMGVLYRALGHPQASLRCYQKVMNITPNNANLFFNMANVCEDLDRRDMALSCYRKVVDLNPTDVEAYLHMGHLLKKQNRLKAAISFYLKAVALSPKTPGLYVDLGGAYFRQENLQEALSCCRKALDLNCDHVNARYNLGITLEAMGRFEEAITAYNKVLHLSPDHKDAAWNRALMHLLLGDFEQGWKGYENRIHARQWQQVYPYRYNLPLWDGSPLNGKKIYVHEEQGLGDSLQFIRYLPMVKERGGTVVFEANPQLRELLDNFDGADILVSRRTDGEPEIACDCYIPLLSLPGIFKTTDVTIPCPIPYVFADAEKTRFWRHRIHGSGFKVGVVWKGNPNHGKNKSRSCPVECFSVLKTIPSIRLYGLQKEVPPEALSQICDNPIEINLGDALTDFSDTAGLIANLDLLISVDTSVAHLGGSMGRPVWLLLPFVPDWRWRLGVNDSPWYPTMRLFRQTRRGDWETVMQAVKAALQPLVKTRYNGGH